MTKSAHILRIGRRAALRVAGAAVVLTTGLGLAACGSQNDAGQAAGPLTVTFWHSASGAAGESLKAQIDEFNKTNRDRITVNAVYQGSYADAMSKLSSAAGAGALPDLMQASDIYAGFMLDSKLTVPAADLAAKATGEAKYDAGKLVDSVRAYYSQGDKLQAMPYQVSLPVLAVNTDMLKAAGVDQTAFAGDAAHALATATDVGAKTGKAGMTFHLNPWWNEELTAAAGQILCTPDNGVKGERATGFSLGTQSAVWGKVSEMSKAGSFLNVGKDSSAATTAFTSSQSAAMLVSSGGAGNIAKTKVPVAYLPFPGTGASAGNGVVPGGNSVWVIGKGKKDAQKQAAWQLAAYLGSDAVQVKNFKDSGYLPTTTAAAEQARTGATPQQAQLLDILAANKATPASAGCRSGAVIDVRNALQPVLEAVVAGQSQPSALSELDAKAADLVKRYNERAGK